MSLGIASEPAIFATFDRVCAMVCASGAGMTLRQLSTASALARALVRGDEEQADTFAAELEIDVEALR